MAILVKGVDFTTGDQVTAANLDNLVDAATFAAGAVDNSTTQLSSGAIIVKDGGITSAKLDTNIAVSGTISAGAGLINTTTGISLLTLSDAGVGSYSRLNMRCGSTNYAWSLGAQDITSDALTITPSTAVGGTTFSTPVVTVATTGLTVTGQGSFTDPNGTVAIVSSTGTNRVAINLQNTGGANYYCGIENSSGSSFGATAYAMISFIPPGRVYQHIISGTGVVSTLSATGLAVTGAVSATGLLTVGGSTPASSSAAGVAGTITWDASYIYVCTATNTWKRVAIATW